MCMIKIHVSIIRNLVKSNKTEDKHEMYLSGKWNSQKCYLYVFICFMLIVCVLWKIITFSDVGYAQKFEWYTSARL